MDGFFLSVELDRAGCRCYTARGSYLYFLHLGSRWIARASIIERYSSGGSLGESVFGRTPLTKTGS